MSDFDFGREAYRNSPNDSIGTEESAVGSVLAYFELHRKRATRAAPLVGTPVAVDINSCVHPATYEVNAKEPLLTPRADAFLGK